MDDYEDIDWEEKSDKELSETIGAYIKRQRKEMGKTQVETAKAAKISRSTLCLLESGEPVTTTSLIQVLRALGLLHVMDSFITHKYRRPFVTKIETQKKRPNIARGRGFRY